MPNLRTGVIGVGYLGSRHARALSGIPESGFCGVFDIDSAAAGRVSSEFGVRQFSSLLELLSSVDAVSIVAPTTEHHRIAKKCISRGIHVSVEKPVTRTVSEARELVALAVEKGVVFQVGHVERYNPAVAAAMPFIQGPKFIEAHRLAAFTPRSLDIDVILDLMIHDIDIVLSLVTSPVEKIEAVGVAILSDKVDIANARILFEDGAVANLTASRVSREKMRKIRFFRPNSYVSVDCLTGEAEIYELKGRPDPGKVLSGFDVAEFVSGRKIAGTGPDALTRELADFIGAIHEGREPLVTGRQAAEALKVAVRIGRKIETSMKRVLKGTPWSS